MRLLLALCLALFSLVQTQPYLKRYLIPSSSFYFTSTLCYYRVVNKNTYSNWNISTPVAMFASLMNYDYAHTSTLNSITSGAHTQGFEINVKLVSAGTSALYFTIQDTLVNQQSEAFVWYTVKVHIFMAPKSTFLVRDVQALIY